MGQRPRPTHCLVPPCVLPMIHTDIVRAGFRCQKGLCLLAKFKRGAVLEEKKPYLLRGQYLSACGPAVSTDMGGPGQYLPQEHFLVALLTPFVRSPAWIRSVTHVCLQFLKFWVLVPFCALPHFTVIPRNPFQTQTSPVRHFPIPK